MNVKDKKELTKLEASCESIRENIKECGQLYILVAYKVYELYYYETYKEKYKNIVTCCEIEFGFKKSTTYNLLNIVKKFGTVENGMITYNSVCRYNNYSYKQLVCMLGLSSEQLEKITPDTTIAEIHEKKKFQPVGKIKNSVIIETPGIIEKLVEKQEDNIIEVLPGQLQIVESGELVEAVLDVEKSPDSALSESKEIEELKFKLSLAEDRAETHWKAREEQGKTIHKYIQQVEELQKTIKEYIKIDEENMHKIFILEVDNNILKAKVQQLEEKLKSFRKDC